MKSVAIKEAIKAMDKAITFKSKVGACLYTDKECFIGFNMENKIHKGYHAEEVAIINSKLYGTQKNEYKGIVIVYHFPSIVSNGLKDDIYPACATCRQYLYENTNKDILITVVDSQGNIRFEDTLENLYPYPYPIGDIKYASK
jgi:cytidine deaminase